MTHLIRAALRSDLPAIARIAGETALFPSEMAADLAAPGLSGAAPDLWFITGDATGFAFAAPERLSEGTWNLLALAVLPDRQGRGRGTALIGAIESALRQTGARLLLIETLGTPDFDHVRALYTARGYRPEATIRDYYMPGGDKVIFTKAL